MDLNYYIFSVALTITICVVATIYATEVKLMILLFETTLKKKKKATGRNPVTKIVTFGCFSFISDSLFTLSKSVFASCVPQTTCVSFQAN